MTCGHPERDRFTPAFEPASAAEPASEPAAVRGRIRPRRAAALAMAAAMSLAALASLAACSGSGGGGKSRLTARPAITVAPAGQKLTVRVTAGRLSSVEVTAPGPGRLNGALSGDRATWTSTVRPAPGVTYSVLARGAANGGGQLTKRATFTTAPPDKAHTVVGEYLPDKGTTVGVGMPVSIVFDKPITDRAAVERRLEVTASPAVDGSWSWMKDRDGRDRVDYRPRSFWKSGTRVTLRMNLAGVDTGGGLYGTQDRAVNFTVGKAVTATVDTSGKTMTVRENGRTVRTLPVSSGKPGYETWNGTMVVLSKVPSITMNSRTVRIFGTEAYNLKDVKWDVQLTPSGTYVHAAPWNDGKFGRVNGSHGCIGMSTADAEWFFQQVGPGDPVTVVNSKDTVAANNGYGDWNVPWGQWTAASALH
jgi:lipoprotein-anchoring transpeptidase ErfK/SrfK